MVLPFNLFENSIPNVSVQSLILESTITDDRFHDFDCDCPPENENFLQRMFYLQLPVALLIIIERGSDMDSTVSHCPVTVIGTLSLYNMMLGKYHRNACVYRLVHHVHHRLFCSCPSW